MTRIQIEMLKSANEFLLDAERALAISQDYRNVAKQKLDDLIESFAEPTKRGRPSGSKNKTAQSGTLPLQEQAPK
ncbi:MAG TPA: hypothetical protein VNH19_08535 [Candidatus Limnocylindrales bacterium]|nr:hypothetical protein [Candidatus Limnocylindrales bacterium]